jgi:acetyltransferase-like isoleucine patch superfamily enzyme
MKKMLLLILVVLPSPLKIALLRMRGHKIGKGAKIGIAYLDIRRIEMGANTKIANFSYFKNIQRLSMDDGARIGGWGNWFTASRYNFENNHGFGVLVMGKRSGITGRHYFDLSETISIGAETLVAGFHSVFYTHGYTPETTNINKPITIGAKGYIGSHCIFLPGSVTGDCTFVGSGAVVTKDFSSSPYVLLGGNPASVKKAYDPNSAHFVRTNSYIPQMRNTKVAENQSSSADELLASGDRK